MEKKLLAKEPFAQKGVKNTLCSVVKDEQLFQMSAICSLRSKKNLAETKPHIKKRCASEIYSI